jgi:DivIVA domain-containing protein
MALTPEDVVNKRFQPTKFREGYDQDEVDDFLDEVVVELRRLGQENEELRQRLVASDARIAELQRSGGQAAPAPAAANPFGAPVPAPEPTPAPAPAYAAPAVDANPLDPNNTNNLLQLARRLHEEHVREGVEKRDALIAEGQTQAQRIVQEAEQASQARLAELEQSQRAQLGALDQERQSLESRIEELRGFERDYRQKLRGYIEGQLRDLDNVNLVSSGAPSAPAPQQAPVFSAPAAGVPQQTFPGFAQS